MDAWEKRPKEIAYLLNPAFCGRILFQFLLEYEKYSKNKASFSLIYLVLPLVLHKHTREQLCNKVKLIPWAQTHSDCLILFSKRAKDLMSTTSESLQFLICTENICITPEGELTINNQKHSKDIIKTDPDDEIKDYLNKTKCVARLFAKCGKEETIFMALGVKP